MISAVSPRLLLNGNRYGVKVKIMSNLFLQKKVSNVWLVVLLIITSTCFILPAKAQKDSVPVVKTYRIGIFAPLYLDTIFTNTGSIRFTDAIGT
jgi:hypothetical protein